MEQNKENKTSETGESPQNKLKYSKNINIKSKPLKLLEKV